MIYQGDSLTVLKTLQSESVNCCITSPPYWGLRDYGVDGQFGLEATPEEYVENMVSVFREVRRVLRDDGTLWLNLGDSYAARKSGGDDSGNNGRFGGPRIEPKQRKAPPGLKPKDLVGIPWMVAFALRADGWYLRSDIIWSKPNAMPESVLDRPTKSHEYIFLLSKNRDYFYDADAIKERALYSDPRSIDGFVPKSTNGKHHTDPQNSDKRTNKQRGHSRKHAGFNERWDDMTKKEQCSGFKNKRSVWTVPPAQLRDAHFATFPEALITPCVLAGCAQGGVVLDPFFGAGTTGVVAKSNNRNFIGIELNPEYIKIAEKRLMNTSGVML